MDNYLYEDFNYWIGIPNADGEAVNRQELKPFLTILKKLFRCFTKNSKIRS